MQSQEYSYVSILFISLFLIVQHSLLVPEVFVFVVYLLPLHIMQRFALPDDIVDLLID